MKDWIDERNFLMPIMNGYISRGESFKNFCQDFKSQIDRKKVPLDVLKKWWCDNDGTIPGYTYVPTNPYPVRDSSEIKKPKVQVYSVNEMYEKEEKDKPIVEKLIPEKSVNTFWGGSGTLKSTLAMGLTSSVASGKKFLGLKVRKVPCLYLSTENPVNTDRRRFRRIFKGMGINAKRRKFENLQLLVSSRTGISVLNDQSYYNSLKEIIAEKKIKLLVIDTLSPLITDSDDNSGREIVQVFNYRLFPLVDEFGVSILIISHSQKTGKDFLGSVKIKASCDSFAEIQREDNLIHFLSHKTRDDREYNMDIKVHFTYKKEVVHSISFEKVNEYYGLQTVKNKFNNPAKNQQIGEKILELLGEKELSYSVIVDKCKQEGYSIVTVKRVIHSLYEDGKIKKKPGKMGGYYLP